MSSRRVKKCDNIIVYYYYEEYDCKIKLINYNADLDNYNMIWPTVVYLYINCLIYNTNQIYCQNKGEIININFMEKMGP